MFGDKLDGKLGARPTGMLPPPGDDRPAGAPVPGAREPADRDPGERDPASDPGTSGGHPADDEYWPACDYWPAGDYWPVSDADLRRMSGPGRGLRRPEPARLGPPA
jgi:hypothetical protein